MVTNNSNIEIIAFYKFVNLPDYVEIQPILLKLCQENNIKGTILLAKEGLNGTVSGTELAINNLKDYFSKDQRLSGIIYKKSLANFKPFYRMKVKLKKEIVTLGIEGIDPSLKAGKYVEPEDWNNLISDPNTIVIDTRNVYETKIGSFKYSIDPKTTNFREFPEYAEKNLKFAKDKKIAMYCTGGIRCEKSTALLLKMGFKDVYHLNGGILNYLEKIPSEQSLWQGECFVFDNRVAVNKQLEKGKYEQCHGCRHPITKEDMQSDKYLPGVHCPGCYDTLPAKTVNRAIERQKQMQLAKSRNEIHLGDQC